MIVQYHKIKPEHRDRIRNIENKFHVGYIRFLLCQRINFENIRNELLKLGFSPVAPEELYFYFREVVFPVFQKYKIQRYYYQYKVNRDNEKITFDHTFGDNEDDRISFCYCVKELEVDMFFANEILAYYKHKHIPTNPDTGRPVIELEKTGSLVEILQHSKRHVIETMLADGKTPKQISNYLDKTFNVDMTHKDISDFAKAFFKVRKRDLERTIDDLQEEKEQLTENLKWIKDNSESFGSLSEQTMAIGETKKKINDLDAIIKRMQGHHSNHVYQAGILEYAGIREMFADVMLRTHKRFVDIDDLQPESEAVGYLSTVVSMMSKAAEKIMAVDDKLKETTKKSVSDEMLEVIIPTMDRVIEEEKEAQMKYGHVQSAQSEILGIED